MSNSKKHTDLYPLHDESLEAVPNFDAEAGLRVGSFLMDNDSGWISIQRKIREHWIWKDSQKLKWWIDIIMEANHADKKINIGNRLIECKRGQTINSLETWSKRWLVNKGRVRRFLILLQNDNMICIENVKKTTRITICNYDTYQVKQNKNETKVKRKRNVSETQVNPNNNYNNYNNKEKYKKFIDYFNKTTNRSFRGDNKSEKQFNVRIKEGYTSEQFATAIKNALRDKYLRENPQYLTPEYITRQNILEKWINLNPKEEKKPLTPAQIRERDMLKALKDEQN